MYMQFKHSTEYKDIHVGVDRSETKDQDAQLIYKWTDLSCFIPKGV
jgi:hypothetical protein